MCKQKHDGDPKHYSAPFLIFFSHLNLCSLLLLTCTPGHRNSAGQASRTRTGPAWPLPNSRLAASLCYRWICSRSCPCCSSLLCWRNTPLQTNMASAGEWAGGKWNACVRDMQSIRIVEKAILYGDCSTQCFFLKLVFHVKCLLCLANRSLHMMPWIYPFSNLSNYYPSIPPISHPSICR